MGTTWIRYHGEWYRKSGGFQGRERETPCKKPYVPHTVGNILAFKTVFAHVPKNAFTLTEIVISVTILGILSLIGVLSYSDSLFSSKDATRISDLGRIEVALRNEKQKSGAYPKPGEFFVLVAS